MTMRTYIHIKNQSPEHESGRIALQQALRQRDIEVVDDLQHAEGVDFVISIGGDGTLLSAVHKIGDSGIPVVGINFGHLGFLTTAGREDIDKLVDSLKEHRYTIEPRTMLEVKLYKQGQNEAIMTLSALNEVFLHRCDNSPLLHARVESDGDMVANYAADGLIVATPTGSTAYSLSCGGPILTPNSGCFALTPIAAHTLTQRPVILADTVSLRLSVEDSDVRFALGVDSTMLTLDGCHVVAIKKAPYCTQLIRIDHQNFFSAIRDKLMWGL